MRNIDRIMAEKFWLDRDFKLSNTQVQNKSMKLHQSIIAKRDANWLTLTPCGFYTQVTKSRLNGILELSGWKIKSESYEWYFFSPDGEKYKWPRAGEVKFSVVSPTELIYLPF